VQTNPIAIDWSMF
jgi:serine/threonine protein kinase